MCIKDNQIVSEKELETTYQELLQESQETGLNAYDTYINKCRSTNATKTTSGGFEKHHIVPRFDQGTDDPENLIFLTVKQHVIAHWIRWKVLGKRGDRVAFLFRVGETQEALAQRQQAILDARERDKENQQGFFNSEFQSEMGRRGGALGGSKNTAEQFLARQKVGQTYGEITGIGNQGEYMKEFLQRFSIWAHSSATTQSGRSIRLNEQFFVVDPKTSFANVARALNAFVPGSIVNSEALHKVVYGKRPQMYGWRIVNTLTRSEAREGIQEFYANYPTQELNFEPDTLFGLELD